MRPGTSLVLKKITEIVCLLILHKLVRKFKIIIIFCFTSSPLFSLWLIHLSSTKRNHFQLFLYVSIHLKAINAPQVATTIGPLLSCALWVIAQNVTQYRITKFAFSKARNVCFIMVCFPSHTVWLVWFFFFFIEHKMLKNDVLVAYCNHAMFYMFLFLFHVDCDMRNFLVHFPLKESKSWYYVTCQPLTLNDPCNSLHNGSS